MPRDEDLVARVAALEVAQVATGVRIASIEKRIGPTEGEQRIGFDDVATDGELDDPRWGDPQVRFDPRDWRGQSFKGLTFSQCPAPFLRLVARAYGDFAEKNKRIGKVMPNGKPAWEADLRIARKARGWALRKEGAQLPIPTPPAGGAAPPVEEDDDGIPF